MIKLKNIMGEGKDPYPVYHSTYSSAVQAASKYAEKRGYVIDEDDWWRKIATGPKKPSKGKTNSVVLELTKGGKPNNSTISIRVFNRGVQGNTYELNAYINVSNKKVK